MAIQWAARHQLLHNAVMCPNCQHPTTLVAREDCVDKCRWQCRTCNFVQSVRSGSFFSGSKLEVCQIVVMMYCWACDMSQKQISREAGVMEGGHAVGDWCNFFRDECKHFLDRNSQISRIDDNEEAMVVEIDESKFFHRKYHRGQWREDHWVFG